MDTLRLVEVAGDGSLVLMTGDGRRFSLAVDEQVRSAVRRSRNGTHETPVDGGRPGPREVQARIRAGADAEQVAAQTGLDVDYVRRFEGPVLAERAHVADLARATAVDRGGDPTLSLERVVLEVLTGEGYAVDDIRWDSRKVEGTRWQVVVSSREGVASNEATWGFDTGTRSLEPVDAEAERLTGVERRRRLSAVRESVFDVERPAPSAGARGGTVELLDALARQRGRRPVTRPSEDGPPVTSEDGPLVSTDDVTAAPADAPTGGDSRPGGAEPDPDAARPPAGVDVEAVPADARASGLRVVAAGRAGAGREQPELSIEPDLLTDLDLTQPPSRPAPRGTTALRDSQPAAAAGGDRRNRRRRAAVPSWDEIVFGAKREDG